MTDIVILDVGHGNSAIVTDQETVVVIDAAPDDSLLRALRRRHISVVDHFLMSHADEDHIGGAVPLLAANDIRIRHVHLNPDAARRAKGWDRLIVALEDAERRGGTRTHPELTDNIGPGISFGDCEISVLFPTATTALRGIGGALEGRRLTANSMSAVIKVQTTDGRSVLFAGDSDDVALGAMQGRNVAMHADVLVYPHHGARARSQRTAEAEQTFASELTEAVAPRVVAFSLGRTRYENPRPDVVKGVRDARAEVRIVCTQFSTRCSPNVAGAFPHLTDEPSSGESRSLCCAGSLTVVGEPGDVQPDRAAHLSFIETYADNPMCLSADLATSHGAART
jgi:beta-lactamase superfamily II metal-dependent hydrolase